MHTKPNSFPRLTVEQCATLGEVSKSTIRRMIATGDLPAYRLGRAIRIAEEDFANAFAPIPTYRSNR